MSMPMKCRARRFMLGIVAASTTLSGMPALAHADTPPPPPAIPDGSELILLVSALPGFDFAVAQRGPSVQLDPPPPPPAPEPGSEPEPTTGSSAYSNGRCVGWEGLLTRYSPGWSVERMSRIMYRESRCGPRAYNRGGRAHGLLQVTPVTFRFLAGCMGESITSEKLFSPVFNIRAAACLFREDGYRPWALTA